MDGEENESLFSRLDLCDGGSSDGRDPTTSGTVDGSQNEHPQAEVEDTEYLADSASEDSRILLGFCEDDDNDDDTPVHLFNRKFFPSKVGGKPAWLEPRNIPTKECTKCGVCGCPMFLLLQLYAPRDDIFHRSIFVFVCHSSSCSRTGFSDSIKVFRCLLPHKNPYYDIEPPLENDEAVLDDDVDICAICGCAGVSRCSRCKKQYYCGKVHQADAWSLSHKKNCGKNENEVVKSPMLFRELVIVVEDECGDEDSNSDVDEPNLLEKESSRASKAETLLDSDTPLDENMFHSDKNEDPVFQEFLNKMKTDPSQVIRFSQKRSADDILWMHSKYRLDTAVSDIPPCPICGGKRSFEFQILSTLLYYLKLPPGCNLDWGVLVVFTCNDKNCMSNDNAYVEELIYRQPPIAS